MCVRFHFYCFLPSARWRTPAGKKYDALPPHLTEYGEWVAAAQTKKRPSSSAAHHVIVFCFSSIKTQQKQRQHPELSRPPLEINFRTWGSQLNICPVFCPDAATAAFPQT